MIDLPAATAAVSQLVSQYSVTRDQMAEVLTGPADGGVNGTGYYRVTLADGVSDMLVPSPAKIAALSIDAKAVAASGAILLLVEDRSYQTQAALNANLAPAANKWALVTNDPVPARNGFYSKVGASGAGTWSFTNIGLATDSPALSGTPTAPTETGLAGTTRLATSRRIKDQQLALGSNVASGAIAAATGAVANGAVFYDMGSAGVTAAAGGWRIPAGQTGRNTQATYVWQFAPQDAAKISGQKIRLAATLQTSSALLTAVPGLAVTVSSDAGGQIIDRGVTTIDDTHVVAWVEYLGAGTETKISLTVTVPGAQAAVAADAFAVLVQQNLSFVGVAGGAAVTDELALDAHDRLPEAANLPAPVTLNGATLVYGGNLLVPKGIDVPAGNSADGSSIVKWALASDLARYAGETVRVAVEFAASDYLIDPAKGFFAILAVSVNGAVSYTAAVANSTIVTRPFRNIVRMEADYVVAGAAAEYIGVRAGFANKNTTARRFEISSITFRRLAKSASESRLLEQLRRRDTDSGDLIGRLGKPERYTFGNSSLYGNYGVSIAAGQTGLNAFLKFPFPAESAGGRGGSIMEITGIFDVPDDIPAELFYVLCSAVRSSPTARVVNGDWGDGATYVDQIGVAGTARKIGAGRMLCSWKVALTGTEIQIIPFIQLFTARPVTTSAGIINLRSLRAGYQNSADPLDSASTAALALREGLAYRGVFYTKTIVVATDGTGDYATLKLALAAIGPGESAVRRTKIEVREGVYTDIDHLLPPNVDVIGIGRREYIRFDAALAASWAPADIQNHQTFFVNATNKLANLTITCRNMRYPVHSDSSASSYMAVQEVLNCHIEHYGNQDAVAYQTSLGANGNPSAVWASGAAWGMGMHSAMRFHARDCIFKSLTVPFFFHTNGDFEREVDVVLEGSRCIQVGENNIGIAFQPMGSGRRDRVLLRNPDVQGPMQLVAAVPGVPWLSTSMANQPGNPWEITVRVEGPNPPPWIATTSNAVLALRSPAGASSSVAVSGAAAAILFGRSPDVRGGGLGLGAVMYSQHAIANGTANPVSLAARLGNRSGSGAGLSIVVTLDGSITRTTTLSANYSAMTNDQVAAALNTALNMPAGYAFSVEQPYAESAHVATDFDFVATSAGSSAILKFMALAFAGSRQKVRPMTPSDDVSLFAGFAQGDAVIGADVRVLGQGGQIVASHALWSGAAPSFVFGDYAGVTDTGLLSKNGGTPVLRCVGVNAVFGPIFRIDTSAGGMLALPAKTFVGLGSPVGNAGRLARLVDAGGSQLVFAQGGKWCNLAGAAIVARPGYSFADGVVLAGVTGTRLSAGTYVDAGGTVQTAALNAARINFRYAGAAWVVAGILNEATATNSLLQSNDTSLWGSRLGIQTGNPGKIIETTATGQHRIGAAGSLAGVVGSKYCASVVASELAGSAKRYLVIFFGGAENRGACFDLATGVVTQTSSNIVADMIPMGPGQWLCWATLTSSTTNAVAPLFWLGSVPTVGGTTNGYTGDGVSGITAGDAQLELAALPSSRIRTTTAAVTRAADVIAVDWAGQGVADGAITARYTFDDGTTQDVATTVAGGTSTIPTNLNRPVILRVEKI